MPTFDTTFEIDAPVARVWSALTDFEKYGEWNIALPSLAGDLRVGSTLDIALVLGEGAKPMAVKAEVLAVEPERRFTWQGNLGAAFIFKGFREFVLESVDASRTRVRHVESLTGAIVPVFMLAKGKGVVWHHHTLNACLKERSEAG